MVISWKFFDITQGIGGTGVSSSLQTYRVYYALPSVSNFTLYFASISWRGVKKISVFYKFLTVFTGRKLNKLKLILRLETLL